MSHLTDSNASAIAKSLKELSNRLGKYRADNRELLSREEKSQIETMEWTLRNYSADFTSLATRTVFANKEETLDDMTSTVEA